jgi:putative transposase
MRDRDRIYGGPFRDRLAGMGTEEVLSAPRSSWQNPFVERLIGSVRRECLDHMIVLGQHHLRRILASYFAYYHRSTTHLPISKDAPASRAVMSPETGEVVELPEVGGLHHRTSAAPPNGARARRWALPLGAKISPRADRARSGIPNQFYAAPRCPRVA